jgi:hypothetical protein
MGGSMIDYFSKWAEAGALQSKHGEGVAAFLTQLFLRLPYLSSLIKNSLINILQFV